MALASYETLTAALLQSPSSPIPLIPTAILDTYIAIARKQVAAEAECIHVLATLALSAAQQVYGFSAITIPGTPTNGIGSVIAVRSVRIGGQPIDIRAWEWFAQYYLGNGQTGTPVRMSQQGQSLFGTLWFDPTPNATFSANLDVVCLPVNLVDDTTPEAIPPLWTDAVPFYAAWLAMQNLQRQADAEMMLRRYESLVRRGRQFATPTELPDNLPGGSGAAAAASRQILSQPPEPPGQR